MNYRSHPVYLTYLKPFRLETPELKHKINTKLSPITSTNMKDLTRKLTQLTHLTSSENHYRWKDKTHEQVFHSYENIIEKLVEFVSKSNSNSSQSLQDFHSLVSQKSSHSSFDPYSTPCLRMKSQYYNKFLKFNDGAKELELTRLDLQCVQARFLGNFANFEFLAENHCENL